LLGLEQRSLKSAFPSLGSEERRVFGESGVENVGIDLQAFDNRLDREVAALDSILASEDFAEQRARART
jgi:hypothetical protein